MSGTAPRRDNGLRAESYDRVVDVETHLVDGLLERLRDEEVAAYTAPTPGRRGHYGEIVPPLGPSDSVWVDSARRTRALQIIDRYLAEVADEIAWAGIVADFDREPGEDVPRWPVSEDVDPSERGERDDSEPIPPRVPLPPAPRRSPSTVSHDDVPQDHFEPPPPPPLPAVDTVTRFAFAGALGGPAVLLLAALAGLPLGGWVGGLAVAAFMAGFVTLVARMKDRPPTDTGPDDGAVV